MKFEKRDKVLLVDMSYFGNSYHYRNCVSELTVLDADDVYWTPYYGITIITTGTTRA
jgi:hypothetical protein